MNENIKHIFTEELEAIFSGATKMGLSAIEITAGSLEKRVSVKERTPACCNAMRSMMRGADAEFRRDNVKENSTTNRFRFHLPR